MSAGKHSSGEVRTSGTFIAVAAGSISLAAGAVVAPFALIELFRYSPYENPGALGTGLWLGVASAILIGVPLLVLAVATARALRRHYRAWKRTLTPAQRFALTLAEVLGMEAAHLAWRDHNRDESSRLTASVMGEKRDAQ